MKYNKMFPVLDLPGTLGGLFNAQILEAAKIEEVIQSFRQRGATEQQIEERKTKALHASHTSIRSYSQCLGTEFEDFLKKRNGTV